MAELDSEDSSDGTLVIDEPNYNHDTIEIIDDSDVEIIETVEDTSSTLNPPSSSIKSNLTCKLCNRIFSTNNDLLNHIRKFKGRIGGCKNEANIIGKKSKNPSPELEDDHVYKKKKGNSPKLCSKQPVPKSIPISPQLLPVIFEPVSPTNDNCTNDNYTNNNFPSAHQTIVEDNYPEYQCTKCGQIFRHYIGLICHMNSEHYDLSSKKIKNAETSSTKSEEKKQSVRKSVIKENKQFENHELISNVVDLTLLPDSKKDSLLNRMKSYVQRSNKNIVICVLCSKEFNNTKRALAHIEDKHIINKIECGYCHMKFVFELKLRSHMARRHKMICVYKCDKCSKMINQEEGESHLKKCKGNPVTIKSEEVNTL